MILSFVMAYILTKYQVHTYDIIYHCPNGFHSDQCETGWCLPKFSTRAEMQVQSSVLSSEIVFWVASMCVVLSYIINGYYNMLPSWTIPDAQNATVMFFHAQFLTMVLYIIYISSMMGLIGDLHRIVCSYPTIDSTTVM